MTFDECLAELQEIHHSTKLNGGRSTKGTLMRKTFLSEAMIKSDWKRFFEIFQDQFDDYSHLIIKKAVHESPILLFEAIRKAPGRLSTALSVIPEVKPLSLRKKQLDVIVKCIQNGGKLCYLSCWDDLFGLLEKYKPEAIEILCYSWLRELSTDDILKTANKNEKAESFLNRYENLLSSPLRNHLNNYLADLSSKIRKEQEAQRNNYMRNTIADTEKALVNLRNFANSVTGEYIENQKDKDLQNKEELLSFDMEFTDNLYHSLDDNQILIAYGDDEMQYASEPFYVLDDIQKMLYNLLEYHNCNDREFDLNSLLSELKDAGLTNFARYLKNYAPEDHSFTTDWLDMISEVEHYYWEGGYAGVCRYYFMDEKEYPENVNELKQVSHILADWAENLLKR